MSSVNLRPWAGSVRDACREAGRAILAHRASAAAYERKADGSPVTAADHAAAAILRERLAALDPGIAVVCEEDARFDAPRGASFWLVDPLDGTREFVRGGELFTVNVALIEGARAVFGLVHTPADGRSWWGGAGLGSSRDGVPIRARALPAAAEQVRMLLSPSESARSPSRTLARLLARWPGARCDALPGALKFCLLAEGEADLYPRATPSCGWDTAAGQAIVEGAGGAVLALDGTSLAYVQQPGWINGEFVAVADAGHDWRGVIGA